MLQQDPFVMGHKEPSCVAEIGFIRPNALDLVHFSIGLFMFDFCQYLKAVWLEIEIFWLFAHQLNRLARQVVVAKHHYIVAHGIKPIVAIPRLDISHSPAPAQQKFGVKQPNSPGNPKLHRSRPLRDNDLTKVRMWLERKLRWTRINKADIAEAIEEAARQNVILPIRHYLEDLPKVREDEARSYLENVLHSHFGLRRFGAHPDTIRYSVIVFRKWLISAVARAMKPGYKADHVLILEGPQGAGKSTAIHLLCGDEYFGDSVPRLDTKDAADYVRGKWIIELSELSSFSKTEVENTKAFVTRVEERFRPAYRRNEETYQRRCVFVGTTNRTDYLRDETGNRRFWPIKLESVDLPGIEKDRDRIWVAAKSLFDAGENWWLSDEEAHLAAAQQQMRTAVDTLYEDVAEWLRCNNKHETCMTEVANAVLVTGDDLLPSKTIALRDQYRLRGALTTAGYESTGRKFTSGKHKGRTIFKRIQQEPS